jgi:uncharacterized membrane protein HdeD (DUF308 family)
MAVGGFAIAAPLIATFATVYTLGILLMAGGVVQIVNAFLSRTWGGFFLHVLIAVLHLILGELMIEHPILAGEGITLVLALAFMIGGLARILFTLTHRFSGSSWVLLNGVITLLLGTMIWRQWPESSLWVIGLFVGIDLIFCGWSWVMLGALVKGVTPGARTQSPASPSVPAGAV